jgi:hypothetical protein
MGIRYTEKKKKKKRGYGDGGDASISISIIPLSHYSCSFFYSTCKVFEPQQSRQSPRVFRPTLKNKKRNQDCAADVRGREVARPHHPHHPHNPLLLHNQEHAVH